MFGPSVRKTVGQRLGYNEVRIGNGKWYMAIAMIDRVLDDVTSPVVGGRRCTRLAEVAV